VRLNAVVVRRPAFSALTAAGGSARNTGDDALPAVAGALAGAKARFVALVFLPARVRPAIVTTPVMRTVAVWSHV
jgi:acyl dehydratase